MTSAPAVLKISAVAAPGGSVRVSIDNEALLAKGFERNRVGIRNVWERMLARFGTDATLMVGPRLGGRFRAEILMHKVIR